MAPAIPDRWLDYKPIGKRIEGTRFIAFKVPLKEHIINHVKAVDTRLDGNILLKAVPNLGLIVDLTNTNRYYDPNIFQSQGVEHIKLMIPGKEIPPKSLINKFHSIINDFLDNNANNEKLIGVHCTHGIHRSGFLICSYMILQMSFDPEETIRRFDYARGHKIERLNYIEALHELLQTRDQNVTSNEVANWRERNKADINSRQERGQRERYQRNPYEVHKRLKTDDQHVTSNKVANWRARNETNINSRQERYKRERYHRNNYKDRSGSRPYNDYRNKYDNYRNSLRPPTLPSIAYDNYRNRSNSSAIAPFYANNYRNNNNPYCRSDDHVDYVPLNFPNDVTGAFVRIPNENPFRPCLR